MAIPSVISSLVTVVYNMADTFFVGQTGDALQVAAVSLTNPIFILLMAFANMFGMGGQCDNLGRARRKQSPKREENLLVHLMGELGRRHSICRRTAVLHRAHPAPVRRGRKHI